MFLTRVNPCQQCGRLMLFVLLVMSPSSSWNPKFGVYLYKSLCLWLEWPFCWSDSPCFWSTHTVYPGKEHPLWRSPFWSSQIASDKLRKSYWKWPQRVRWFIYEKWWCSIVMLVYQRVFASLRPSSFGMGPRRARQRKVDPSKLTEKDLQDPSMIIMGRATMLVGGLQHGFYVPIYWEFHNPNWLSDFSEGLKPPTNYSHERLLIYGIWKGM